MFEQYANEGVDGLSACCGCGGGVREGEAACMDNTGWIDNEGDNCAAYRNSKWCENGAVSSGWEADWGELSEYAVGGLSASDACCDCGGGGEAGECHDMSGWADIEQDTCATYASEGFCTLSRETGYGWEPQ